MQESMSLLGYARLVREFLSALNDARNPGRRTVASLEDAALLERRVRQVTREILDAREGER